RNRADPGGLNDLFFNLLPDFAAGNGIHLLKRRIAVRDCQQSRHWRPVLKAFAGNGHLDRAQLHAVNQVNLAPERVVRENLYGNSTVRQRGELLTEFEGSLVPRVLLICEVTKLKRQLLRHRRGGEHGTGDTCQEGCRQFPELHFNDLPVKTSYRLQFQRSLDARLPWLEDP